MSDMSPNPLFNPIDIGGLHLPNRVVMAPMTRYFSPGGIPDAQVARYYARRAAAGVGLIVSEGTYIPHPSAHSFTNVPHFYGEAALAGWKAVCEAVHAAGGRIFPQLWHVGGVRERGMEPAPDLPGFAPSVAEEGAQRAMTEEDIADVIAAYAIAAGDAQRLGFDGIELHGAHGYLIDTFFWHGSNSRTDRWGGSLVGRARFGVEVVKAVRERVGEDFPVCFRWSQFKQQDYRAQLATTPQELEPFLGALSDAGVTMFHASGRRFWQPAFPDISDMSLAGWTRKLTGKPTIAVGSVGLAGISRMEGASEIEGGGYSFSGSAVAGEEQTTLLEKKIEDGEFDLIAVGRSLLADPEWASKMRDRRWSDRIAFDKAHLTTLE